MSENDTNGGGHSSSEKDPLYYVKAEEIESFLKEGEKEAGAQEKAIVATMKLRARELNRNNEVLLSSIQLPMCTREDKESFKQLFDRNVGEQMAYLKVAQWLMLTR